MTRSHRRLPACRPVRAALAMLTLAVLLSGCGAVSAVSRASDPLDSYTLTPLPGPAQLPRPRGHLVVELPSTGGALASDRILIKVTPQQAQYLPDARWSDPTPALVQTLLLASLLNQGRFALVSRAGAGLQPDQTLMTEILAFQAELTGMTGTSPTPAQATGRAPVAAQVHIALQLTLIRETDRAIIATRRFAATAPIGSDASDAVVAGLDQALQGVLRAALDWLAHRT